MLEINFNGLKILVDGPVMIFVVPAVVDTFLNQDQHRDENNLRHRRKERKHTSSKRAHQDLFARLFLHKEGKWLDIFFFKVRRNVKPEYRNHKHGEEHTLVGFLFLH